MIASARARRTGLRRPGPPTAPLLMVVGFDPQSNVDCRASIVSAVACVRSVRLRWRRHSGTARTVRSSRCFFGAAGVLFLVEFFADKVPAFDLLWNALQTFVRIPVAALIAYGATSQLSPEKQVLATVAGGLIALAAHGGKTAARAAVTPSPEPMSNIALSMGEDVLAVSITWFATRHPILASAIVLVFLVAIIVLIRWVVRALKNLFRGAETDAQSLAAHR